MSNIQNFIEKGANASHDGQADDPVDVTPETVLTELPEWDSLAALGVIVMFDIEYSKIIIGDDLKQCVTLQDLFKLLER